MIIRKFVYVLTLLLLFSFSAPRLFAEDENQVNLNAATVEDLVKIPGLDQELAKKIIDARDENGEFIDMEELLDVDGIDLVLLDQLKQHLMIKEMDDCNC